MPSFQGPLAQDSKADAYASFLSSRYWPVGAMLVYIGSKYLLLLKKQDAGKDAIQRGITCIKAIKYERSESKDDHADISRLVLQPFINDAFFQSEHRPNKKYDHLLNSLHQLEIFYAYNNRSTLAAFFPEGPITDGIYNKLRYFLFCQLHLPVPVILRYGPQMTAYPEIEAFNGVYIDFFTAERASLEFYDLNGKSFELPSDFQSPFNLLRDEKAEFTREVIERILNAPISDSTPVFEDRIIEYAIDSIRNWYDSKSDNNGKVNFDFTSWLKFEHKSAVKYTGATEAVNQFVLQCRMEALEQLDFHINAYEFHDNLLELAIDHPKLKDITININGITPALSNFLGKIIKQYKDKYENRLNAFEIIQKCNRSRFLQNPRYIIEFIRSNEHWFYHNLSSSVWQQIHEKDPVLVRSFIERVLNQEKGIPRQLIEFIFNTPVCYGILFKSNKMDRCLSSRNLKASLFKHADTRYNIFSGLVSSKNDQLILEYAKYYAQSKNSGDQKRTFALLDSLLACDLETAHAQILFGLFVLIKNNQLSSEALKRIVPWFINHQTEMDLSNINVPVSKILSLIDDPQSTLSNEISLQCLLMLPDPLKCLKDGLIPATDRKLPSVLNDYFSDEQRPSDLGHLIRDISIQRWILFILASCNTGNSLRIVDKICWDNHIFDQTDDDLFVWRGIAGKLPSGVIILCLLFWYSEKYCPSEQIDITKLSKIPGLFFHLYLKYRTGLTLPQDKMHFLLSLIPRLPDQDKTDQIAIALFGDYGHILPVNSFDINFPLGRYLFLVRYFNRLGFGSKNGNDSEIFVQLIEGAGGIRALNFYLQLIDQHRHDTIRCLDNICTHLKSRPAPAYQRHIEYLDHFLEKIDPGPRDNPEKAPNHEDQVHENNSILTMIKSFLG